MKVYVILKNVEYEGADILCIKSTKENAISCIRNICERLNINFDKMWEESYNRIDNGDFELVIVKWEIDGKMAEYLLPELL